MATTSHDRQPRALILLANAGVRTPYGVPIIEGTELLGVAKMASPAADDFSTRDERMFRAMVATGAIDARARHDGSIAVESSEQGGARFTVTLPIASASPPTPPIDKP